MGARSEKRGPFVGFGVTTSMNAYEGYIYLLRAVDNDGLYKIGMSRSPKARSRNISKALPFDVELVHAFFVAWACDAEMAVKHLFTEKRIKGEWYRFTVDDVKKFVNHFTDDK